MTISNLKPFGCKCYVHIQEEEHFSASRHLLRDREHIIIGDTSVSKVYRVFTLEDEYVFMTRNLSFLKKTSPQEVTILRRMSHDLEQDPGYSYQDQGPKDASTTTSVHTRIRTEVLVLDQDWYQYLLKYPVKAVKFYNTCHPVICWLVSTLYEIKRERP
jgi:hypothetical protein